MYCCTVEEAGSSTTQAVQQQVAGGGRRTGYNTLRSTLNSPHPHHNYTVYNRNFSKSTTNKRHNEGGEPALPGDAAAGGGGAGQWRPRWRPGRGREVRRRLGEQELLQSELLGQKFLGQIERQKNIIEEKAVGRCCCWCWGVRCMESMLP